MTWESTPAGGMSRPYSTGRIIIHRHGRVHGKWQATLLPDGQLITPTHAEHLPHGVERARAGWDSIESAMTELDNRFKEQT